MSRAVPAMMAFLAVPAMMAFIVMGSGLSVAAATPGVADPLYRPSLECRFPSKAVLLDVTKAGTRLVAVGERGIIVFSDDGGRNWRQAKVPTSVSLTSVQFVTPKQGWAVGEEGVVLHSEDGGETWTRQLDGVMAAQLALKAAQADIAKNGGSEQAKKQLADAQHLVSDGPKNPFLDLYFENEQTGFVVGAFGLIFRTDDGGKTWESWMDRVDNPGGLHISTIRGGGKNIYLAGEQGLFLRSTDGGNKFTRLQTPYKGTFFTMAVMRGGVVVAGMGGNAYWLDDQGKTFRKIDVPIPVSIADAIPLENGSLLLMNQAGQLLMSSDEGRTVIPVSAPPLPQSASMVQLDDGTLMTVGVTGVVQVPLPKGAMASGTGEAQ